MIHYKALSEDFIWCTFPMELSGFHRERYPEESHIIDNRGKD
jgi:hypothetical protein